MSKQSGFRLNLKNCNDIKNKNKNKNRIFRPVKMSSIFLSYLLMSVTKTGSNEAITHVSRGQRYRCVSLSTC